MNFDPLSIVNQSAGAEEHRRLHYCLNAFAEQERDTLLDGMFYYWDALRRGGRRLPLATDFRPNAVFGPQLLRHCHGVDTRSQDPANFVILDHPDGVLKSIHGGMSDKRISDFPSRLHTEACMAEYELCRRTAVPMYHEIDQIVLGFVRRYRRLMLPLIDTGGNVVRIAFGIRYVETPIRLF